MKGKIADSIIVKVGHGILTIPRNGTKEKQSQKPPASRNFKEQPQSSQSK